MKLLFLGDVVGETGRLALYRAVPELREQYRPDAVIVNGENAAGGRGITFPLAAEFFAHGVDVITLGDHVWDQKDTDSWLPMAPQVLRPFNLQEGTPGHGSCIIDTKGGRLGVLNLIGRTFMAPIASNPFTTGYEEARRLKEQGAEALIIDIHGEATSEKIALALRMDGIASAVFGTHTHVPTADARILPGGTACMTDVGMCGSRDGIIGRDAAAVLKGCITGMPCKYPVGGWPAWVCGALVETDTSGHATSIHPIQRDYQKEHDR